MFNEKSYNLFLKKSFRDKLTKIFKFIVLTPIIFIVLFFIVFADFLTSDYTIFFSLFSIFVLYIIIVKIYFRLTRETHVEADFDLIMKTKRDEISEIKEKDYNSYKKQLIEFSTSLNKKNKKFTELFLQEDLADLDKHNEINKLEEKLLDYTRLYNEEEDALEKAYYKDIYINTRYKIEELKRV